VVGNSVIDRWSSCDKDSRTIAQMVQEISARPTLNASFDGQTLSEMVNLSALALKLPHVTAVVVPVSLFTLLDEVPIDPRTITFFRLVNGSVATNDIVESWRQALSGSRRPATTDSFIYEGTHYPAYGERSKFLNEEKRASGCPETLGDNLRFIAALYWAQYARLEVSQQNLAEIFRLRQLAHDSRKKLVVTILPIDFGDMARLSAATAQQVVHKRNQIVTLLAAAGVQLLDLSEAVRKEDFADRWCACGHLQQSGRLTVASRITAELAEASKLGAEAR
jgi:hypothetical protein